MKGTTLIEIMLVIAIALTAGFFSAAFSTQLVPRMALRDSAEMFRSALRKAESYAVSGRGKASWGVHYGSSRITLFKGDSYAVRDQTLDEQTEIHEKIGVAGFSELVFVRPEGIPSEAVAGITLSWGEESATLSVNGEGVIE